MVSNSVAIARQLMMSSPTLGGGATDNSSSLPMSANLHLLKSSDGSNTLPKKITFDESAKSPSTPCTRRNQYSQGTTPPKSTSSRKSSTTGAAQHQTPLSQFSLPRRHYASASLRSPDVDNESECSLSISISVAETNSDDKENCRCAGASSPPIERIKSQLAKNRLRRQNVVHSSSLGNECSLDCKRSFVPETMGSNKRCKVDLKPRLPASSGHSKECKKVQKRSLKDPTRQTSSSTQQKQKQRAIMKNALNLMKTSIADEESTISCGESGFHSIRSSSTFSRRWLSQNRMRISNVHSEISVFSVSPMKNEVKAYSDSIRIHNESDPRALLKAPTSFPSVSNTLDSYIGTIKETTSTIGPPQFHNTVAKVKANCARSPTEAETMSSQSSSSSERYIRDSIGEHRRPSKLEESEDSHDSDDNGRDILTPLPPSKPLLHRSRPSPMPSEGATSLAPSFTTSMVTSTVTSGGGEDLFNVLLKTFDNGIERGRDDVDHDTRKDHGSPSTSHKPHDNLPNKKSDRGSLSFAPPTRNLERGSHTSHIKRPLLLRGPSSARKKKRARSLGVTPKTSHKTRRQDESSVASDHDDPANLSFLASALVATSMLASSPFPVKEEVASSVETETPMSVRKTPPLGSLPVAYMSTNEVRAYDTIGATECRTTPRCIDPMAMALEAEMLTPIRHQHSPGTPKCEILALADDERSTRETSDGKSHYVGEIASFDRRLSQLERRFNGSTLDPAIPDVTKPEGSNEEVSKLRQRVLLLEKVLGYERSNDGDRPYEKRISSLQERLCVTEKRLEEETARALGLQTELEATRDNHQKAEALRDQVRGLTEELESNKEIAEGRESELRECHQAKHRMQVELDACARDNKELRLKLLSFAGNEELRQVTLSSALRELKSLSEDHFQAKHLLDEERRSRQDEVASLQWSLDDISTQMLKMSETMHELQAENSQLKHEMRRMRMERERSLTMLRSARGY